MQLTKAHIEQIIPNASANGLDKEWDTLLDTLRRFEINTKNRIAAFLMNVAKESGELYYVEENADGWAYEGRLDLGNTETGDGPKFKGHGYIQITGRANHRTVGKSLGIDTENNPLLLTELPYTWLSAGWYWTRGSSWGDLNEYADEEDFRSTILGVRGGPDPDREHYWWTAMDVLPEDLTLPEDHKPEPTPEPTLEPAEWPTKFVRLDSDGWVRDFDTGAYIRFTELSAIDCKADNEGWVYAEDMNVVPEPLPEKWEWPEANDAPIPGGYYWQEWPTRYDWLPERKDVEKWARYMVDKYPEQVWANTYHKHPPDVLPDDRKKDSVDFWGYAGRGYAIDQAIGQAIFDELFNDPDKPDIEWIIWNGWLYSAANSWQGSWWGDHFDHVHVSYLI